MIQVKPFLITYVSSNGVELYFFETLEQAGIKSLQIFCDEDFDDILDMVIFTDLNDGTAFVLSGDNERDGLL